MPFPEDPGDLEVELWKKMSLGAHEELISELTNAVMAQCDVAGMGENATISEVELELLRGQALQPFWMWMVSRQGAGAKNPDSKRFALYDSDLTGNIQMKELREACGAWFLGCSEEVPCYALRNSETGPDRTLIILS